MLLEKKNYFIKRYITTTEVSLDYNIIDQETGEQLGFVKDTSSVWAKMLRYFVSSNLANVILDVYEKGTQLPIFIIKKSFANFSIFDSKGIYMGGFKGEKGAIKPFEGGLLVLDAENHVIGEVKLDWDRWAYNFIDRNVGEIGRIIKRYSGVLREHTDFTENYFLEINNIASNLEENQSLRNIFLLASGICVSIIYKGWLYCPITPTNNH